MANVIFCRADQEVGEGNYVYNPDVYFKYNSEDEWFDDAFVQEMVMSVDGSKVLSANAIESPVLGVIAPERLSGGVKALILMYKEPNLIINASACGDNCAKWILEIGKKQDITIRLGHEMLFEEPFSLKMDRNGKIIQSYEEFMWEYLEVMSVER